MFFAYELPIKYINPCIFLYLGINIRIIIYILSYDNKGACSFQLDFYYVYIYLIYIYIICTTYDYYRLQ